MNYRLATSSNQIHDTHSDTSGTKLPSTGVEGYQSENTFEERREIVNFTDDQAIATDSLAANRNLPRHLLSNGNEVREHSVKAFLKRPEKIANITWTTDQPQLTNLISIPVPSSLLTTMYREKLKGFGLLRADVVFKLQLNSQPFQAGRLLMTYTPVPAYLRDRFPHTRRTLARLTALPNLTLDISKQTEINITVPYISSLTHYNLIQALGDWAVFDVWVYSPLNSNSDQSVNISVRAYFDNVELGALTQQSLATFDASGNYVSAESQGQEGIDQVTLKERKAGPITTIGQGIRGAIGSLDRFVGKIPIVGDVFKDVNGLAMGGLNILSRFGFGKPTNIDNATPVFLDAFRSFPNGNGVDNSHNLTIDMKNTIMPLPGFAGSEVDELSLKYLMQTPQYYATFPITTDQSVGTMIWGETNDLWKEDIPRINNDYSIDAFDAPHLYAEPTLHWYVGSNFNYWKGDIIYHITLVKTDYHSVRLKFVYDPMALNPSDITYTSSEYCYSVVLDFRDKTDFYVRIPFVSSTPWKNVLPSDAAYGTNTTDTVLPPHKYEGLSTHCGCVALFIDNTLRASQVVPQSINVILEIAGSDNFELAAPMEGRNFVPFHDLSTPVSAESQMMFTTDGTLKPRSDMQVNTADVKMITETEPDRSNEEIKYTVGEDIQSLRQLIKRSNFIMGTSSQVVCLPNEVVPAINTSDNTGGGHRTISGTFPFSPSLYDIVGALYCFRTGGVRYKLFDTQSQYITALMSSVNTTQSYTLSTETQNQGIGNTAPLAIDCRLVRGSFEVNIPYYHLGYNKTNSFSTDDQFNSELPRGHHYADSTNLVLVTRANGSSLMHIAKSAADDTNFGFLLGVPRCVPYIAIQNSLNFTPAVPYFVL